MAQQNRRKWWSSATLVVLVMLGGVIGLLTAWAGAQESPPEPPPTVEATTPEEPPVASADEPEEPPAETGGRTFLIGGVTESEGPFVHVEKNPANDTSFPLVTQKLEETAGADATRIALGFAGPQAFTLENTTVTVDPEKYTVTLRGTSTDFVAVTSGTVVDVLVVFDWVDVDTDFEPTRFIAARVAGFELADLLGVEGLPDIGVDSVTFTSGESPFSDLKDNPDRISWVDNLPDEAVEFFQETYGTDDVTDPVPSLLTLDGTLHLAATARPDFLGDIGGEVFGVDPESPFILEGRLPVKLGDSKGFDPKLSDWDLAVTLPRASFEPPDIWPDFMIWPDDARLTFKVAYDSEEKEVTLSASTTMTTSIGDAEQDVFIEFTLTIDKDDPSQWSVGFSTFNGGDWTSPFGLDWLEIEQWQIEGSIGKKAPESPPNAPAKTTVEAKVVGVADIAGRTFRVEAGGKLAGQDVDGNLSVSLTGKVGADDVLSLLGVDLGGTELSILEDLEIEDPGIVVDVKRNATGTPSFLASVGLTGGVTFPIPGTNTEVGMTMLASVDTEGKALAGIRSNSDLSLSTLMGRSLGTVDDEPIDFTLAKADGSSAFGMFLATDDLDGSIEKQPRALRRFFRPLFGFPEDDDTVFNVKVPAGVTAIGSFQLPEFLAEVVDSMGLQSKVTASGTLPFLNSKKELSLSLSTFLKADDLPGYIDSAALNVTVSGGISGNLSFGLGGRLGLRFPAGIDEDLADALLSAGIPVRSNEPVDADSTCPGDSTPVEVDGQHRCYDVLNLAGQGAISVNATGEVKASLTASLSSGAGEGWQPFGLEWVTVKASSFSLEFGVSQGVPTVGIGLLANGKLGDKSILFAIDANATGVPPGMVIELEGIRFASGEGFALSDFLDIQYEMAKMHARMKGEDPDDVEKIELEIPDVGIRNAQFSFAPQDNPALCIRAGLIVTGDLYVNASDDAPAHTPSCVVGSGGTGDSRLTIPPEEDQCLNRREDGCVASVSVDIGSGGIFTQVQVPSFDLGPLHMDDLDVDLAVSMGDQHLTLKGGAALDSPFSETEPLGEGRVIVDLKAGDMFVHGFMKIFGFNAVVDMDGKINLFNSPEPSFRLRVQLMADFGDAAAVLLDPPLRVFKAGVTALDGALEVLQSGNPLDAVPVLQDIFTTFGVTTPEELTTTIQTINKISAGIDKFGGFNFGLNVVLNGVELPDFPGVPSAVVPAVCAGIEKDGGCWIVPPGCVDLGPFGEICSDGEASEWTPSFCAGTEQDGGCWLIPPEEGPQIPGLCDLLLDDDEPCSLVEILSPVLLDAFTGITGLEVPSDTTLGTILDDLGDLIDAAEPQLRIDCAAFELALGGATENQSAAAIDLDLGMDLFGFDVDLGMDWDFTLSPAVFAQKASLDLDDLVDAVGSVKSVLESLMQLDLHGAECTPVSAEDEESAEAVLNEIDIDVAASPSVITEGGTVTLTGTVSGSSSPATISWGDGSSDVTVEQQTDGKISATHGYVDDGPKNSPTGSYTISVTVDGETVRTPVTVTNVAPTVTPSLVEATSVDEGTEIHITGDLVDPGAADQLQVLVEWGDGSRTLSRPPVGSTEFRHRHTYSDDDPTGTTQDTHTIKVTVEDDDTGKSTATTEIVVRDVAPTVSLEPVKVDGVEVTGNVVVKEGSVVTYEGTISDPGLDSYSVTATWGDGTSSTTTVPKGNKRFWVSHRFVDDNPTATAVDDQVVTVEVTDDDGLSGSASYTQKVANVAPTVTSVRSASPRTAEGAEAGLAIEFGDPGTLDTHTLRIDWGDGTAADVKSVAAGERRASATHVYVDDDPSGTPSDDYTVTLTLTDDDTGATSATRTLTIDNVDPELVYGIEPVDLDEGAATAVVVGGLVQDVGLRDTHVVTVDWGEGWGDTRYEEVPVDPETRGFRAERRFGDDGVFDVVLTVTDDDTGSSSTPPNPVTVTNIAPDLTVDRAPTEQLPSGEVWMTRVEVPVVIGTTTTDPGSDDLGVTWAWGDGSPMDRIDDLVNPPDTDPDPSPSVQPRSITSERSHTYVDPCVRAARVAAEDDDEGHDSHARDVAVVDDWEYLHSTVFWESAYRLYGKKLLGLPIDLVPQKDLTCYLGTVRRLSSVFGEVRTLDTPADAARTLSTVGAVVDLLKPPVVAARERLERDLLAAWLNLASGATGTTDDGRLIPAFRDAIVAAEAAMLNSAATPFELFQAANQLDKAMWSYSCRADDVVSDLLRPFRKC